MKMKCLIAVMLTLCFVLVGCGAGSEKDYDTIETLTNEMSQITQTSAVSSVGDNGSWNVFELGLMYEKDDEFFKQLSKDLGDDFSCKLSNGDSLFIGVLPFKKSYRIYAGSPDESHMIYPNWNYEKLKKKE